MRFFMLVVTQDGIYFKFFDKNNDAISATDSLLQPTYVTQHLDSSVFIKYFSFDPNWVASSIFNNPKMIFVWVRV